MCSLRSSLLCALFALILTILSSPHHHAKAQTPPTVTTSLGNIVGKTETIPGTTPVTYYSYRGIQYATATRFKAPKPIQSWTGDKTASNEGPICPQITVAGTTEASAVQDENCLYLNIYSPQLPTVTTKLPVLVFIHGGGFSIGSGSSTVYGPEMIMSEGGVVLVTLNYRLGIFGYFSTGTKDAQGNAGMKDQVEALKFVKNQISNFGGDPDKITIFGESAGAASVTLHLISPMSQGLFHRAIAESGSVMGDWANIDASEAYDRATKIARNVACDTENATMIVNCLNKMTVSALLQATASTNILSEEKMMESTLLFSPVIETKFDEDTFLADSIENVLNNVKVTVPLIIGTNKDEGMLFLSEKKTTYDFVDRNLKYAVPRAVKRGISSDKLNEYGSKLRQTYFDGKQVSISTLKGYVDLYTDHLFMYPTVQLLRKLVEKKTGDVYLYHFSYSGGFKMPNQVATNLKYEGIAHAEELGYLFYMSALKQPYQTASQDTQTMTKLITLWKSFAANGVPTANGVQWSKISTTDLNYLEMGTDFKESTDYYKDRIAVWDQFTSSGLQMNPTIILTLVSFLLIFKMF